jgi:putative ABC transport system permease protein
VERGSRLVRIVRSLLGRGPVDRALDAEVTGYLEMLADEKMAAGLAPDEAFRQARLELGGVEQVKEEVRGSRPAAWLDNLARDVRGGMRQLAKAPAFSLTVALVLALGIGANVAVFGLINVLLLQPRVGSDQPGELVSLHVHDPKTPASYRRFSYSEYEDIRRHAAVLSHAAGYRNLRVLLSDNEASHSVTAAEVTSSYFSALGVRLVAGRTFTVEEERPGSGAAVAVVNYETWQALGGGSFVPGRTITVNSHRFSVVGIAPEGFAGTLVAFGPRLWVPLGADALVAEDPPGSPGPAEATEGARRHLSIVGRLTPDTPIDAANAALATLSPRLEPGRSSAGIRALLTVSRLARTEDGEAPGDDSGLFAPLGTLAGMAALLLLVASLNVANMQLARGTNRRKEMATRLALGAGRGRIVLQLLAEGLLLSLAGGIGGLIVGVWTLQLVAASFTPVIDETLTGSLAPDVRVVVATVAFSMLSAALFAVGPSLRLSRLNLLSHLKGRGEDGSGGDATGHAGPRNLLVACQAALALALLVTAGLFVRGALGAGRADPGYPLANQILVRVGAPGSTALQGRQAFQELLDRLRATPGVEAVAAASLVAFGNSHSSRRVEPRGASAGAPGAGVVAQIYAVGADYFRTLELPLIRGREFTSSEEQEPARSPVVVIDEPLARALFPGREPVGQYVELPAPGSGRASESCEIVGLVAGQRERLTDAAPVPHMYRPIGSHYQARINIHVRLAPNRGAASPEMVRRLRDVVRTGEPRLAMLDVSTLEQARDRAPVNWLVRTAGVAFGALGGVGLWIAVIGLYGVKAYLVARRSREIGIRMALGATPRGVIMMVLRDGGWLLAAGVLVGLLLALAAGYLVSSMLVGVRPLDPLVVALATVVLVLAVAAASYVPARRATRIDPALAFRSE